MATRGSLAPFTVGKKELYLPNVQLTFLRTKHSPANTAKFHVPLWFSKLDLRDYLFHVYNVRILSVRSYVKQSRVVEGDENIQKPQPSRWHRPRARKFMTVELVRPFVWPDPPSDLGPWNKAEMEEQERDQEEMQKLQGSTGDAVEPKERRERMREQAKALLEGRVRWKPAGVKETGRLLSR